MKLCMFRTVLLSRGFMIEHPDPARKLSANLYDVYLMQYVQF
jgi:hypothetical protein